MRSSRRDDAPLPAGASLIDVAVETVDGATVAHVDGELDLLTVPYLREELAALTGGTGPLVVDLSAVRFLSSSAVQLLLDVHEDVTGRGRPLRVVATGTIRRPLEITGLVDILGVVDSVPAALDALREN